MSEMVVFLSQLSLGPQPSDPRRILETILTREALPLRTLKFCPCMVQGEKAV